MPRHTKPIRPLVLIVEDDQQTAYLVAFMLNRNVTDYNTIIMWDSERADYKTFDYRQVRCVIIDLLMPAPGGAEIIQWLKKTYPAIRLILITGLDPKLISSAVVEAADKVLTKPF